MFRCRVGRESILRTLTSEISVPEGPFVKADATKFSETGYVGGTLPRSGYTKQPRALALGQVVSKSALEVAPDVRRAAGITRE